MIFVIDVARARIDPAQSVIATVRAGCSPVRLVVSPAGDVPYVSARNSDALLAFETRKLLSDPAHALTSTIPVGRAPVGVALIEGGRRLVVANSNRFSGNADSPQSLAVIDVGKLAAGAAAVVRSIPAGSFPRELSLTADERTLLVTNFSSRTVEFVDPTRLALQSNGSH
jgi:DNA-binding beta-propeller fold protein YncE